MYGRWFCEAQPDDLLRAPTGFAGIDCREGANRFSDLTTKDLAGRGFAELEFIV
jgi:hypothetical protein